MMRDASSLHRFDRLCHGINAATELLLALLVAATVSVTFIQVICRYGLDSSLSWSEELARYLFVWIIFLGSASAARRGQHMAVDVVSGLLPAGARRWSGLLVLLVTAAFFAVFGWLTWLLTDNARGQTSAGMEISVAWVYAAGPTGAILTLLHLFNGMLRGMAGLAAVEAGATASLE